MSGHRPTQLQACGVLRPIGEVTDGLVGELKFHRQIEKLHRLGPRPYGELLVEIGEQLKCRSFIDRRLEAYAALDPNSPLKKGLFVGAHWRGRNVAAKPS